MRNSSSTGSQLNNVAKRIQIFIEQVYHTQNVKGRNDPVILMGMHRSGTSLLAKIILDMGVFIGQDIVWNDESLFFLEINEWLLWVVHGNWDMAMPADYLAQNRELKKLAELEIHRKLESNNFFKNYVGITNIRNFCNDSGFIWGWKDPRATLFLPIWKNVFPKGKYIFIYRNGVDVAESLRKREIQRCKNPSCLHDRFLSMRCLNLKSAFQLWEEYNNTFFSALNSINNLDLLQIRYEDLLEKPVEAIKQISDFISTPIKREEFDKIVLKIKNYNSYKFLNNPELVRFYNDIKNTTMMKKFDYNNIEISSGWVR